jgi:choline dehydrogenase-like flavoprotein
MRPIARSSLRTSRANLAGLSTAETGYAIRPSLMTPRSRGTVRLASAEPVVAPVFDPNYYADDPDLTAMATGLHTACDIGRASALDAWRGEEVLPGPDVHDDGLRAYPKESFVSYNHPVGTCWIGADETAVVGPDLRVHGIDGRRVSDASVMPSIVSANPNATVYGIAERAAALLQKVRGTGWRFAVTVSPDVDDLSGLPAQQSVCQLRSTLDKAA